VKVIDDGHSIVWCEAFNKKYIAKTVSPQAVASGDDGLVMASLDKFPLRQDKWGKEHVVGGPYSRQ
jgi:hypothetical protein